MARNVAYVNLYPWSGGLNTAIDPIILNPEQLQICDNVVFSNSGSRKKRGGQARFNTTAITVGTVTQDVLYGTDYWANVSNTKRERIVVVTEAGWVLESSTGATWNTKNTAALSVAHGRISTEVMNEDLLIGYSKTVAPHMWSNQSTAVNAVVATATAGSYPVGWILRAHKNRMFVTGSAANPDRVYFSGFTGGVPDHTNWGTSSGFIDIQPGDGDPEGITAIFPEIRQARGLYIAKRNKIYFLDTSDSSSSNWYITLVSDGIGCCSHNSAVSVDQSDVIFCSDRGVHSLAQVLNQTGIIEGQFLSRDIHYDYQEVISNSDRSKYSAVWFKPLNSYLLSVKRSGQGTFETVYGFNVELKQWYRWTSVPCNFLFKRFNASTGNEELKGCDDGGYVNSLQQDATVADLNDFNEPIVMRIKSSVIYPSIQNNNIPIPGETHFTNFAFAFRARDNSSFRVYYNIDGNSNSFTVEQRLVGGNTLGSTALGVAGPFLLGSLGNGIKPYFAHAKGVGHSVEVTIEHDTVDADLELFGMWIEFKQASESQNPFRNTGLGA